MGPINKHLSKWERNGIALLLLSSLFVGVPISQGAGETNWAFLGQLECLYILHGLGSSGLAVLPALVLLASHISLFFLFKLSKASKAIYFIFFIPLVYQLVFCLIFGPLYLFLVPFFLIWVVFYIIYYVRTKAFKN
jgi:hypothetical protein